MKKCFATAVLFAAGLATQLHAQTVNATYTATHLKDVVKAVFTGNIETTDTYTAKSEHPPTIFSYVYCDKKSVTTMTDDNGYSQSSDPTKNIEVISPTEEVIFKDHVANIIRMEWTLGGEPESFKAPLRDWHWKVTREKAEIAGYKCFKATGTYNQFIVTAWFTKDIKVSDGPGQFSGLPGLILKARIGDMYEIVANEVKVTDTPVVLTEPEAKSYMRDLK